MDRFRLKKLITSGLVALLVSPLTAIAQEPTTAVPVEPLPSAQPLWEIGLGGGATYVPDYPGSDQSRLWAIPFPWGIYRGEILHSDRRGGTRARFIRGAHYEFNLSAAGGLPSRSDHNEARRGMPNLEFLGETGPRLSIDLLSYPSGSLLRLGLPLRLAFSTDFRHFVDRGFSLAPELLYDNPNAFGTNFDAFVLLTVNFNDRRLSNYFYEVKPEYATAERKAYKPRAGYFESDVNFGVMLPIRSSQIRFYTFATLTSLAGSVNEDSPLMRTKWNTSVSAVLIWAFAQSKLTVKAED